MATKWKDMNKVDEEIKKTPYHELNADDTVETIPVTPAFVRECALTEHITSGPGMEKRMMPTLDELNYMIEASKSAVSTGKMIDFGHWPNDMIREVGSRAGVLYSQGALGHPFRSPYIIVHTWKDEKLPFSKMLVERFPDQPNAAVSSCAYLVNPLPESSDDLCIDFEVTVLEGVSINGVRMLGVGDRALLNGAETRKAGHYAAHVIPFFARFPEMFNSPALQMLASNRNGDDIAHSAVGNALDPILVALMLLNTRGVAQTTVSVDAKLQKARARRGKPPIPPYRRVDSASYVTAIMQRVEHVRKPPQGGTHATPEMHVRLGHWRHLEHKKTFVRDTLVNATDELREKFYSGRSHYVIKESHEK